MSEVRRLQLECVRVVAKYTKINTNDPLHSDLQKICLGPFYLSLLQEKNDLYNPGERREKEKGGG